MGVYHMEYDFTDQIDSARVEQRVSKAGKPYFMLVIELEGGLQFQYLCLKGEDNVVRALLGVAAKKAS